LLPFQQASSSILLLSVICFQQISSDSCTGVLFLDDSDTIAAVCGDHVVFLQLERERDFHTLKDGHSGPVVSFCYLEKGKAPPGEEDSDWLFSAGADGTIKQWDMDSMMCKNTLRVSGFPPFTGLRISRAFYVLTGWLGVSSVAFYEVWIGK
jgi:WD40 repeat protein